MPGVVTIEAQPLTLAFKVAGQPRSYTPDLRVTFADGSQALVEAKGAPFEKQFRELLGSGLRRALRARSLPLYLVPGRLIDHERASRISDLRAMARRTVPNGAIEELLLWVAGQRRPTIGDAEHAGHPLGHIGYAIGRRLLTVGPSFDLSPQQPLQLIDEYEQIHIGSWLGDTECAEDVAA